MSETLLLRRATRDDVSFLRFMLFEAAFWRPEEPRPAIDEGLAHPELAHLLADWGKESDTGVIAEVDDRPAGAAWYRFWNDEEHSYGYIDPDTPELAIAVAVPHRGSGIGRALLRQLLNEARLKNVNQVSLSVEMDNPARKFYLSEGFAPVDRVGNAETMLWQSRVSTTENASL